MSQAQREKILNKFKKKKTNVLVATDVAARGLDIDDLTHVINFALPQDPEAYLHRIGRTGRAGKEGTAITFVSPEEYRKLMFIKNITKTDIRKGRIPQVQEVINFKKEKIAIEIKNLITKGVASNYVALAKDLLEGNSAEEITSALIQYAFQNSLEEGSYANVQDFFESKRQSGSYDSRDKGSRGRQDSRGGRGREDKPRDGRRREDSRGGERRGREEGGFRGEGRERGGKGQERLFIAVGKKDGLSPKKLVDMLMQKTNIESRRIDAVQVMDTYSFFSVSPRDAEVVLEKLNSKKKGDRTVVERAKPSK
ncbi:MAG: helicase-related protein [Ignavibacteriaceae bacterium]